MNGIDQRLLSLLMSRKPSSTSQSTSDRPFIQRSCVSAINSIGPRPMRNPAVGPKLSAQDFSKNFPSCAARPGVCGGNGSAKVPLMSPFRLMPNRNPTYGREAGTGEEDPLAAFDAPIVEVGEVHVERRSTHRADIDRLRRTPGDR